MKGKNKYVIFTVVIILGVVGWLVARKYFFPELEAERLINHYYSAIMDEDYEEAFNYLYIYDHEYINKKGDIAAGSPLSKSEAKVFYLEKIEFLKEQDYQLKGYRIVEVEYEDGHSFWHHIELEVVHDGESFRYEEVVDVMNGKLMLGQRDDPYTSYRDGQMNIKIGETTSSNSDI